MFRQITPQMIDLMVDRIAASGILGTSERQLALLRYLLAEELGGRGEHLKAYSIGTDVLGRGARFDPGQDAIVRVEVGRLRKSLDLYFATTGRAEPLRIIIEKGNYRPQLVENVPDAPRPVSAFSASGPISLGQKRGRRPRWGQVAMWVVVAALVATQLFQLYGNRLEDRDETPSEIMPQLIIEMPEVAGLGDHSETVKFDLQAALAQELRGRSWLSISIGGNTSSRTNATFALRPALSASRERWAMTALLTREPSREVVWAGRYDGHDNLLDPDTLRRVIAAPVNRDLGPISGPIAEAVAIQSALPPPSTANIFGCVVNLRRFLRYNTQAQFTVSKACITQHLQSSPDVLELRALLAYLLILEAVQPNLSPLPTIINGVLISDREARREALLREAEVILRGTSPTDRVMVQQRLILAACRGQTDVVRENLPTLLTFNARVSDPYIIRAILLGPVLGEWDAAIRFETQAFSMTATPTPRYQIVSGLRAGLDENPVEALRLLTRAPMHSYPLGHLLVGMFGAEAGSPLHVRTARSQLADMGYKDETSLGLLIGDSCYSEEVRARLRRALKTFVTFNPE